jgi:membrane-bound inhibitor of C-type lysozyme
MMLCGNTAVATTLALMMLAAGCIGGAAPAAGPSADADTNAANLMPPQQTLRDYTYECDAPGGSFAFRIRTGPGEIALWLPERFEGREGGTYRVLGQVRAASGVKYEDGPITVWTHQDTARLRIDGADYPSCYLAL